MTKNAISVYNLNLFYGAKQALFDINLDFSRNSVSALIGPSGCGKSSLLRCFNRINDTIDDLKVSGKIMFEGKNINHSSVDLVSLRTKIGMVFQKPNPFPMSIYDNVAYGPRLHGIYDDKADLDNIVTSSLQKSGLWNEVKDRLEVSALELSGGQQQRLCIARTIAINPKIILMDEPCSALDPIATAKIEKLIDELRVNFTIIIVTHSMGQAARVSQQTIFLDKGRVIEAGRTDKIFTAPQSKKTQDYITGRFD